MTEAIPLDWAAIIQNSALVGMVIGLGVMLLMVWNRLKETQDARDVERSAYQAKLLDIIERNMKSDFEMTTAFNGVRDLARAVASTPAGGATR